MTSVEFNSYFARALERGRAKSPVESPLPYRPSFVGGWLIKQVVPEATRKFPAPKVFQPSQSHSVPGAFEKFLRQQAEFMSYVRDTRGIDYNKIRLRSPVTALMRYSLADSFVVTVVHGVATFGPGLSDARHSGFPTKLNHMLAITVNTQSFLHNIPHARS